MNEFEDKLNALLGDPKELERFADFARSVMGGDDATKTQSDGDGIMKSLGSIFAGAGEQGSKDMKLLEAMRPYLSEKRRDKMDRAMKLARLARLAELASNDPGGANNV